MPSDRDFPLLDRRRFLTNSSMALVAIAGSSVLASSARIWGQTAPMETVEVQIISRIATLFSHRGLDALAL